MTAQSGYCSSLPRYSLSAHSLPHTVPEASGTAHDKTKGHGVVKNSPGGEREETSGEGRLSQGW